METILIRCQRRRRAKHAAKATKSPPVTDILIHYNFNIHALEGKGGVGRGEGQVKGGGGSICRTRNKTYGVQTWAIFGRGNKAKCHEEDENKKGTTWLTLFEKKNILNISFHSNQTVTNLFERAVFKLYKLVFSFLSIQIPHLSPVQLTGSISRPRLISFHLVIFTTNAPDDSSFLRKNTTYSNHHYTESRFANS